MITSMKEAHEIIEAAKWNAPGQGGPSLEEAAFARYFIESETLRDAQRKEISQLRQKLDAVTSKAEVVIDLHKRNSLTVFAIKDLEDTLCT